MKRQKDPKPSSRPAASSERPILRSQADSWQDLHGRFQSLADEEERTVSGELQLCAYCDYTEHSEVSPETGIPLRGKSCLLTAPPGVWNYNDDEVDENFLERFRSLAARAGNTLGRPNDANPEVFWLNQLYVDLCNSKSPLLLGRSLDTDTILRVCEASATFCSRLERKALEKEKSSEPTEPPESAEPKSAELDPLPPKKIDMSRYLEGSNLTDKEHEAASLKYEYVLSTAEIARRLNIHRKSVDERIASAKRKIDSTRGQEWRAKTRAQRNPSDID